MGRAALKKTTPGKLVTPSVLCHFSVAASGYQSHLIASRSKQCKPPDWELEKIGCAKTLPAETGGQSQRPRPTAGAAIGRAEVVGGYVGEYV